MPWRTCLQLRTTHGTSTKRNWKVRLRSLMDWIMRRNFGEWMIEWMNELFNEWFNEWFHNSNKSLAILPRYRREGARLIMDIALKMGLRFDTTWTAVVYFHRFYMFRSFKDFKRYVTATCCLFLGKIHWSGIGLPVWLFFISTVRGKLTANRIPLSVAGKVEETPKKCKDLIQHARNQLDEVKFAQFGESPREEVMTLERILLQTMNFDLQVDHSYSYLLRYVVWGIDIQQILKL